MISVYQENLTEPFLLSNTNINSHITDKRYIKKRYLAPKRKSEKVWINYVEFP